MLQLRKELTSLEMWPTEGVTKYIARARDIREQLTAAGHAVADADVVLAVLAGLPEQYSTLVTVLETADKPPSLEDVLSKIMLVEQRITQTEEAAGVNAFFTPDGNNNERTCYHCGKKGHIKRECRKMQRDKALGLDEQYERANNGHTIVM